MGARLGGRPVVSAALNRRLALIGGTSSCQMAVSRRPRFIGGIWGPYYSAMIPGWWLTEGGQSATGALIDHVVMSQSSSAGLARAAKKDGSTIYAHTWDEITAMFDGLELVPPGLADSAIWRAGWARTPARAEQASMIVAGLGRKN